MLLLFPVIVFCKQSENKFVFTKLFSLLLADKRQEIDSQTITIQRSLDSSINVFLCEVGICKTDSIRNLCLFSTPTAFNTSTGVDLAFSQLPIWRSN